MQARRRSARDARAASSPRGRRGHSAHTLKDCLLIYGGYKDLRGSTNELWAFHYGTYADSGLDNSIKFRIGFNQVLFQVLKPVQCLTSRSELQ